MQKNELKCKLFIMLNDFFWLLFSFFIGNYILYLFVDDFELYLPFSEWKDRLFLTFTICGFGILWFWLRLRHYTYRKPFWFELKEILRTLLILAVMELAIIGFSKLYFSRYLWATVWLTSFLLVPLGRIYLKKWLIKRKFYLKKTIIIGGGENAIDAYRALQSEPYLGLNVKYFVSDKPSIELLKLGIPVIQNFEKGLWKLVSDKSDQFIIALDDNDVEERDKWLRYLSKQNYRSVSVIPSLRGLPLYSTDMSFLFSYDVILLRINHNLAKRSSRLIKRSVDIVLSSVGLVILAPLFVWLAVKIRQDGGKAIYEHKRIGQNGKIFSCLKFRTMVLNSEEVLQNLLRNDPLAKAEWERDFKLKDDPRITPIGYFLRRTSLDELPQLWNVLKGDMSLVGPRPVVKEELARYHDEVEYYLMAKPGMTGLWQVSGRNDVDYAKRVYFDAWYVKNWSLWNDVVILFKTMTILITKKGAY
ncbi:undecaprenyl-phosphate galactose phosphotransferase WbaP [Bibersteinia trehalosi]|uniref:undecaprenyl-phosphate galactose phosphotransferase WbaP n=1 Tax=Bibersteinia trehalosi TaxID=47735 RepID=UPI0039856AB1